MDGVTGDRSRVLARDVAAGIAVMDVPDVAIDVLLQNHDVTGSNRRHARRRSRTREPTPIRRQIELGDDPTKFVQRGLASAERVWASPRTTSDDPRVGPRIAGDGRHGVQVVVPMREMVVPMMTGFRSS